MCFEKHCEVWLLVVALTVVVVTAAAQKIYVTDSAVVVESK